MSISTVFAYHAKCYKTLCARLDRFLENIRLKYRYFILDSREKEAMNVMRAADALREVRKHRPVNNEYNMAIDAAMLNVDDNIVPFLLLGDLEFNGWKEISGSVVIGGILSWTPRKKCLPSFPVFRVFIPTYEVITRDKDGKQEFEPEFTISEEIRMGISNRDNGYVGFGGKPITKKQLTAATEGQLLTKALITLAEAIQKYTDSKGI